MNTFDRCRHRSHLLRFVAGSGLAIVLASCASGPDFMPPDAPTVSRYTDTALPERTVSAAGAHGNSQHFIEAASVAQQWWRELGSARLNALINQAFQSSPTLASARATLRQAEHIYAAQAGSTRYPQVDASLGGQRQRISPAASGQTGEAQEFNLYNANVGVHYQLDLAGGNRRALEALAARADYQRYQLEGARLSLAATITTTAITQARLSAQIQAMENILGVQEEQLEIAREQLRLGQATFDDILALQTQVEQTRADIVPLRQQAAQHRHRLAVLAGRAPGVGGMPSFELEDFTLPVELAVVVPSELVRQRPDIQAAESLLHAANAEYGVAISQMYPQLNLSANLGSQALTTGALFSSGSTVWSLIGQLTQPLFNPGLSAEKRAALAALDAAAANYQSVVLESLRNVADVLQALDYGAQALAAQAAAEASAQASLQSMQRQYALGTVSYLQLLTAQQQAQQSRISLIDVQSQRLIDTTLLYQAMGGGHSGEV
ncbi:MAG: efflux transporter outer membrane subunit [Gammaproteobacteria bacterium]|nr:efflux transporter outer membrane subunit [Gammaproteobacteria bacterium]MCW8923962.1 efflux transporter outer membrane subunit [Gammaproteobacteria bacterium]